VFFKLFVLTNSQRNRILCVIFVFSTKQILLQIKHRFKHSLQWVTSVKVIRKIVLFGKQLYISSVALYEQQVSNQSLIRFNAKHDTQLLVITQPSKSDRH